MIGRTTEGFTGWFTFPGRKASDRSFVGGGRRHSAHLEGVQLCVCTTLDYGNSTYWACVRVYFVLGASYTTYFTKQPTGGHGAAQRARHWMEVGTLQHGWHVFHCLFFVPGEGCEVPTREREIPSVAACLSQSMPAGELISKAK